MVQVLLKHFCLLPYEANCQFSDLAANYIDNLRRLGLIELNPSQLFYEHQYTPLLEHQDFKKWLSRIEAETDAAPIIEKAIVEVTDLGNSLETPAYFQKLITRAEIGMNQLASCLSLTTDIHHP